MAALIVALDFSDAQKAVALAAKLRLPGIWLKVGLELFVTCGPDIVSRLRDLGFKVFLDLKFYDIPNTVARAAKVARHTGADMLTVHLQGGKRMCEAAVSAAHAGCEGRLLVAGVTALTSFASGEMPGISAEPGVFGFDLAGLAFQWGLDCVVCSAREAAAIKKQWPKLLCVCPGIRPAGIAAQDQRRVMTPREAALAGADFLVVGRPITENPHPETAAREILAEIGSHGNRAEENRHGEDY